MIIADDIGASFNFGTVFEVELARVLAKLHGEATGVASESRALAPSQDGRAGRHVRSAKSACETSHQRVEAVEQSSAATLLAPRTCGWLANCWTLRCGVDDPEACSRPWPWHVPAAAQ